MSRLGGGANLASREGLEAVSMDSSGPAGCTGFSRFAKGFSFDNIEGLVPSSTGVGGFSRFASGFNLVRKDGWEVSAAGPGGGAGASMA